MNVPPSSRTTRRLPDMRLVERRRNAFAMTEPYPTPVLPAGWAPLSREQQDAVLQACDGAPEALVVRLGSMWAPGIEYRVYRLANDLWPRLVVATRAAVPGLGDADTLSRGASNRQLLGLAREIDGAVKIAVDFFNSELEAQGQYWRLDLTTASQATHLG